MEQSFTLTDKQQEAVAAGCNLTKRIVAVTGEAGSGKTTVIKTLCEELDAQGISYVLCAFAAKAARRITEVTGLPAMTIHKLLEYPRPGERDPKTGEVLRTTEPRRDGSNRLNERVVIVDEYAMVPRALHTNLINALASGGCVRMFGDMTQLPPVETDNRIAAERSPFAVALMKFGGITLDKVHRQVEGSPVLEAVQLIAKGRMPPRSAETEHGTFHVTFTDSPVEAITEHVFNMEDQGVDFKALDVQIITSSNKSWIGARKLSNTIQGLLCSTENTMQLPRHSWDENGKVRIGIGDKIMWSVNIYDMRTFTDRFLDEAFAQYVEGGPDTEVMNGEVGIVKQIITEDDYEYRLSNDQVIKLPPGSIIATFGHRDVPISSSILEESRAGHLVERDLRCNIELGYVVTTHKAQGSQYKHVVYVMNKSCLFAQNQQNLYTGCSRSQRDVYLITDQRSLSVAVNKPAQPWLRGFKW